MNRIGLVAGEASGDLIAAQALSQLGQDRPIALMGLGGPALQAIGMNCWESSDRLAVRGYVEVLAHLPGLLRLRRQLVERFADADLNLFLGVDAPDFNLGLAARLRQRGLRTAHLVSPSIWAWRADRLSGIEQAVDTMLCLFPHEPGLYAKTRTQAVFVGHPLADRIPKLIDRGQARARLGLSSNKPVLAVLPGSRSSEIVALGERFLSVAIQMRSSHQVVVPAASSTVARQIMALPSWRQAESVGVQLLAPTQPNELSASYQAMQAADLALLASGTATLEAALHGLPMVIAYRVPALTYWLMKRKALVQRIGLPNLLLQQDLVPEFIQQDCEPAPLIGALRSLADDQPRQAQMRQAFADLHDQLAQGCAGRVAQALGAML
ncbi:MAG: lipid-A-disaccharide synthase [Burkholderiaceae bacterium]